MATFDYPMPNVASVMGTEFKQCDQGNSKKALGSARVRGCFLCLLLRPKVTCAITLFLANLHIASCQQRGVEISGYLTVNRFGPNGNAISSVWNSTNYFRISLAADERWHIEVSPAHEEGDTMHMSYDGKDTFYVRYRVSTVDIHQKIIGITPIDQKVNSAYISSGNYPFMPFEEQKRPHVLWLAYGAGSYLRNSTNNSMPLPWYPARWSLMAYGFRVESELFSTPTYVRSLKFIRDSKLDLASFEDELDRPELNTPSSDEDVSSKKADLESRKKYWVDGLVAGELKCLEFTSRNEIDFPKSFEFSEYYPVYAKKVERRYKGEVTNVTDLPVGRTFRPPIIAPLGVDDTRFRNKKLGVDDIHYALTNGAAWLANDADILAREFIAVGKGAAVSGRYVAKNVRSKRIMFAVLFASFALVLPVVIYRFAVRRRQA